jgi:protein-S-isoprenylcysteine O-methyltransferase Ste14
MSQRSSASRPSTLAELRQGRRFRAQIADDHWGVGAPLWVAGNGLAVWGTVTLGTARTCGGDGALIQHGPYRSSRNPQYVGFSAGLIGWPLVSGSLPALAAGLAGAVAVACVPAPLAEEPWLLSGYGSAYERHRRSVSRFLGLRRRGDKD